MMRDLLKRGMIRTTVTDIKETAKRLKPPSPKRNLVSPLVARAKMNPTRLMRMRIKSNTSHLSTQKFFPFTQFAITISITNKNTITLLIMYKTFDPSPYHFLFFFIFKIFFVFYFFYF